MMRTARGAAILTVVTIAALSLAGCQAGQSAATSQDYDPVDGRNVNIPSDAGFDDPYIAVRNAVVVAADSEASLVVTLVNQSPDAEVLEAASLEGEPLVLSGGPISLAAGKSVSVGFDDFATATQSDFGAAPGDWVDLTMSFTSAGNADLQVLVVAYGNEYEPVRFADGVPVPAPSAEG
jgi:hypothetical protein